MESETLGVRGLPEPESRLGVELFEAVGRESELMGFTKGWPRKF